MDKRTHGQLDGVAYDLVRLGLSSNHGETVLAGAIRLGQLFPNHIETAVADPARLGGLPNHNETAVADPIRLWGGGQHNETVLAGCPAE